MIGIVIVAHGGLAKEYLAAVEHVVGRQVGMASVAIEAEHNRREKQDQICALADEVDTCLLYTSPSPRDLSTSRMPSSA